METPKPAVSPIRLCILDGMWMRKLVQGRYQVSVYALI
jgi:hypothetical protein